MWERFSAHMEAHQGDFDGFARAEGCAGARVGVVNGTPTLTLWTKAPPQGGGGRRKRRRR